MEVLLIFSGYGHGSCYAHREGDIRVCYNGTGCDMYTSIFNRATFILCVFYMLHETNIENEYYERRQSTTNPKEKNKRLGRLPLERQCDMEPFRVKNMTQILSQAQLCCVLFVCWGVRFVVCLFFFSFFLFFICVYQTEVCVEHYCK